MEKVKVLILFVDDDEDDRDFFEYAASNTITNKDLKVITLNDGQDLIKYLSDDSNVLPDILFMDINMPKMTGLECLKIIRGMDKCDNLPIVIYTTSSNDDDVDMARELGADLFVKKPINQKEIKDIISYTVSFDWAQVNPESRNFMTIGM
jgi:CheY-like chemotaxis protein